MPRAIKKKDVNSTINIRTYFSKEERSDEEKINEAPVKLEGKEQVVKEEYKDGSTPKDVVSTTLKRQTKSVESKKAKKAKIMKEEADEEEKPKKKRVSKKEGNGELDMTVANKVLATVGNSKKMLGYHVSAAGGAQHGIYNAVSTGCRAFALFIRNQRTWNHKPMSDEAITLWNNALKQTNFDINQILPHGSYLLNPGTADLEKLEKTREGMLDECQRCEKLGIKYYNFHPGSTAGICTTEECIKTVAETLNYIIDKTSSIVLVIETMAKQGNTVGGTFQEIRLMINQVNNKERVGVCIDTCHIFAAGYDIRSEAAYEKTMKEFGEVIGFKYLKGLHINDSKNELGCKVDRHENIGKGKIGKNGFEFLMNDNRLDGIPMILETPEGQYPEEMMLMYGMDKLNH